MRNQMIHTGIGVLDAATLDGQADDQKQINEIKERLEVILDSAPSDAVARIVVKKIRGGFHAFLRIYSKQTKFLVGASAPHLRDAMNQLFDDVGRQIGSWRDSRTVITPEWPDMA